MGHYLLGFKHWKLMHHFGENLKCKGTQILDVFKLDKGTGDLLPGI